MVQFNDFIFFPTDKVLEYDLLKYDPHTENSVLNM